MRKAAFAMVLLGAGMMTVGALRGEVQVMFNKAINLCMECIGIG